MNTLTGITTLLRAICFTVIPIPFSIESCVQPTIIVSLYAVLSAGWRFLGLPIRPISR